MPAKNPRYNRNGKGTLHYPLCDTCGFRVPKAFDVADGLAIPCSEHHVRCVRCQWPIDHRHVLPHGLCVACSPENVRRMYHRKTEDGWTHQPRKVSRKGNE